MRMRTIAALVLALSTLAPSVSRAVTITFEGTIDIWDSSFLGSGAAVGQMFSGVFELDHDLDTAAQDVRDRVQAVLRRLPPGTDPPVINKQDNDSAANQRGDS